MDNEKKESIRLKFKQYVLEKEDNEHSLINFKTILCYIFFISSFRGFFSLRGWYYQ